MIDQTLAVRLRAKQEEIAQILKGGYYKTFIEFQACLFKEYLDRGFTREEALEILLVMIQNNAWNLEPNFNGIPENKGVSDESDDAEFQM